MKAALKSTLAIAATTAAIAGVAAIPTAVSAFSRPLYSLQQVNEGVLGNKITFNSIKYADTDAAWYKKKTGKDLPTGTLRNESNFVGARLDTGVNAGKDNVWSGTEITAEDGQTYIVRLYVHNNNPKGTKAVAKDTQVRFYVPFGSSDSVKVNGWLRSSNAQPGEYLDNVIFKSKDGSAFHLEYVYGSALLENGGFAKGAGVALADSITNQGDKTGTEENQWTTIGYNALDGKIPGCYEYVNYVGIKVKVVYDNNYTVQKQVRIAGDTDRTWKESVNAKIGDQVEFQITYTNTSNAQQDNVMVRDTLPSNLRYVAGSTKLRNSTYPNGLYISDGEPSDILKGINIGSYAAGANAKVTFLAEVVNDNLVCGDNTMVNWGQVGLGEKVIQDTASVKTNRVCEKPEEPVTPEKPEEPVKPVDKLPTTGPEIWAGGILATGSIATAAGYYIASRRQLR